MTSYAKNFVCGLLALSLSACFSPRDDEATAQQEARELARRQASDLQLQRQQMAPTRNMGPQRFEPAPQYTVAPKFAPVVAPPAAPGRAPIVVGVYGAAPSGVFRPAPGPSVRPPAPLVADSMSIARAQVVMVKDEPRCEPYKAQMLEQGKGSVSNPQVIQNLVTLMTNAAGVNCMKG